MKKQLVFATSVVALTVAATVAMAADGPFTKEIKARQGLMQVTSFNLGMLAAMAKGERDYDAKLAAEQRLTVARGLRPVQQGIDCRNGGQTRGMEYLSGNQ